MTQTRVDASGGETACATSFERIGKRVVVGFILIFFIANQFPHTTTIKEIAFYGSLTLLISLLLAHKISIPWDSPFTTPALFFIISVAVGSFWALNKSNTIADLYSHLIRYVILWLIMTIFLEKRRDIEMLLTVIVAATTIFCTYSLIDQYMIHKLSLSKRLLIGSKEITTNLLGINAILSINLALYKVKLLKNRAAKVCFSIAIIVLLLATFATQTRSSLLALVLSALIIFLSNRNLIKLGVALIIFAVAVSYSPLGKRLTTNLTTNIRIQHMLLCLEVVKDYPLTGVGFGMQTFAKNIDLTAYNKRVKETYPLRVYAKSVLTDPHNLYMDIAVRTGLLGFLAFMFFLYTTYRTILKVVLEREKVSYDLAFAILASLSSFMFIGFFEPVFSHPFEAILCLLFALSHILWKLTKQSQMKDPIHQT